MGEFDSFERVFENTLALEGGYSDDPSDSGGKTCYGITEKVARRAGYVGLMSEMPLELAKEIAKKEYWDRLMLDDISEVSISISEELFDTGYNMGIGRAATFLQRCLNVSNRRGKDYPDIKVDGSVGPKTIKALTAYIGKRGVQGEAILWKMLNCLQGAFYVALGEKREKDEDFINGWFAARIDL